MRKFPQLFTVCYWLTTRMRYIFPPIASLTKSAVIVTLPAFSVTYRSNTGFTGSKFPLKNMSWSANYGVRSNWLWMAFEYAYSGLFAVHVSIKANDVRMYFLPSSHDFYSVLQTVLHRFNMYESSYVHWLYVTQRWASLTRYTLQCNTASIKWKIWFWFRLNWLRTILTRLFVDAKSYWRADKLASILWYFGRSWTACVKT